MMPKGVLVLLALLATGVLACDPILGVRAEVRSIPAPMFAGAESAYAEHAISGAKLELACPRREPIELGTTDAAGKAKYVTIGLLDPDCAVRVAAAGYHSDEVRVGDLCVLQSGSTCHFVATLFELVPVSPETAAGTPVPAKPTTTTLRVTSSPPDVRIFVRNAAEPASDLFAYDDLGSAPTSIALVPGKYRLAAALGDREPVEAPDPLEVSAPRQIELSYSDRSTSRALKTVSLIAGIVVGPTLAGIGMTQRGAAKAVLIGSGIAVGAGGVLFAVDLAETKDELGVRPLPTR